MVLIDFWATFCDPCLAAMPHLDRSSGAVAVVAGFSTMRCTSLANHGLFLANPPLPFDMYGAGLFLIVSMAS